MCRPGWNMCAITSAARRPTPSVGDKLTALHRGAAPPRVHRMIERQTIVPTHYERYKRQVNVDMH